jgi:hypothetical protein
MNKYEIKVTYSLLDNDENTITKIINFLSSGNSLEEARISTQETAMLFINRVNGTLILID